MRSLVNSSPNPEEEKGRRELVVTQITVGGFDSSVTAKELCKFLEFEAGLIWRCRVKSSWTPPDSYPLFGPVPASADITGDYDKVVPHAFVQFADPEYAKRALDKSGRNDLVLNHHILRASCGMESSTYRVGRRRSIDPYRFVDAFVEIGSLVSRDSFYSAWQGPRTGMDFLIDPFDGICRIVFARETPFSFQNSKKFALIKCDFKVQFLVRDIMEVRVYKDRASYVMLLKLASVPYIYYRTADDDIYDSMPGNLLDDEDPWIRTSDFTLGGTIGRCNCYRISLSPRLRGKMDRAMAYLKERRVHCLWPTCSLEVQKEPDFGSSSQDPFFCIQYVSGIKFPVLFLVNAVLHKGIVNQHQLSEDFFSSLRNQDEMINVEALQHLWSYKTPLYDPTKRLKLVQGWLLRTHGSSQSETKSDSTSIRNDTVQVRRLLITPTKAFCLPPETELSNRVLRKYKAISDRFLRVTFMDEGMQQLNSFALNYSVAPIVREITCQTFQQKTTIYKRVKTILTDGFYLCGRRYSFLAFSSNQLRDRSAWFFAEDKDTTVKEIRSWMGRFSNRNVAKCAARMGQCFSSTYATVSVPSDQVDPDYPDVENDKYVFSDGIGMITPDLAMEVAQQLQLMDNPPSAYQIRYAGFKGVVAVWPEAPLASTGTRSNQKRLFLRSSMNKFESEHTTLEVVSWTRYQPGFLNRQIVTLLSALGVPDEVFDCMQDSMVCKLDRILVDPDAAFDVLTSSCAEHGNTAALMLSAGFRPQAEPHLRAMLSCIRSTQLRDLLSKARIFVPKGRWLMGCLDELGLLEQGQCFIQASHPSLERCFVKHGKQFLDQKGNNRKVVVGTVAIAKNPCLHPGDVRILEAVDVPGLRHLVDCLVFPQKGERPHPNEASGSDLDGDLYFVTWDENLIPPSKRSWVAMDYTAVEEKKLPRNVLPEDIMNFFLKNMVNENLGVICNAHVVHADRSEYGAMDENCLKLAELAATAVDFPKTGKMAIMPPNLRPKVYPDFMEKDEHLSYRSNKILGKMYRKIKNAFAFDEMDTAEKPCTLENIPYDRELEVSGAKEYLHQAWCSKCSYDTQLGALLHQYRVGSEGEVVTGHIWSISNHNSRKQGELKEKLKTAYYSLSKEFRGIFETIGPGFNDLSDKEKNEIYERKASAWYQVTYHPEWVSKAREMEEPEGEVGSARLSFAWIAVEYLVRIKVRHSERKDFDRKKPIESLAAYLSERL
ncbi:RNA-dependent RNA polymerase [Rhynchospora pubera]|uniref:RNA-dependent RNA polymerase n=1 Tax=Rhynchospora pubera TaxID=906938 RepID=A0AAV8AQG2_9POAL|nr:RNA-dependent RNA polymerase [Rhynchospora pubera]KAJ4770442.1 RNA-dependent RNA polymerase [Rhynchospora pubera]